MLPAGGAEAGSSKHCGAGSATIAVDPFGSVYPCVQWRRAVGSLHESSIEAIWTGSDELEEVRKATEAVKGMIRDGGEPAAAMSFCPGTAAAQTGSPLGLYTAAAVRKGLIRETEGALLRIVD